MSDNDAVASDEQQLANAFWRMHDAVVQINGILNRHPALAEDVPIKLPITVDPDEIIAECRILAEYYEKRAKGEHC
jgi:hypothetical protein